MSSQLNLIQKMNGLVARCAVCLLILVMFAVDARTENGSASEYFVSPTGADQNDGSKDSPFQTLKRAAEGMKPGDICWLRHGRYQAEAILEGLKGTPDKPLIFKSFPGERAILDGTVVLPARWVAWKDGIYQQKTRQPVWQLFTGSELVHVARWPNASFKDGSIWRMEECMRFTDREWVRGKPTGQTRDDRGL